MERNEMDEQIKLKIIISHSCITNVLQGLAESI